MSLIKVFCLSSSLSSKITQNPLTLKNIMLVCLCAYSVGLTNYIMFLKNGQIMSCSCFKSLLLSGIRLQYQLSVWKFCCISVVIPYGENARRQDIHALLDFIFFLIWHEKGNFCCIPWIWKGHLVSPLSL